MTSIPPERRQMLKKPVKKLTAGTKSKNASSTLTSRTIGNVPVKRLAMIGGGIVALVMLAVASFSPPAKTNRPAPPPWNAAADALLGLPVTQQPGVPIQTLPVADRTGVPVIRTIRFQPAQPTRQDILKAEVVVDAPDPAHVTYAYVWKVNDRIVEKATGGTLDLSALKKRDVVSVTITPSDGDREGFPVESPVIVVHPISPSLELQSPQQKKKAGEALEFQLVSLHPDSDSVTFSLEAPFVTDMTVDSQTGKIIWKASPNQKGAIRFGAAVVDSEKTKVTKTFDVTIE